MPYLSLKNLNLLRLSIIIISIGFISGCATFAGKVDLKAKTSWTKSKPSHVASKRIIEDNSTWTCKGSRGFQGGGVKYEATLTTIQGTQSVLRIGEKNTRLLKYLGHSRKKPGHQAWGESGEDGLPIRIIVHNGKKNSSKPLRCQIEIYTDDGIRTQTIRNIKCKPLPKDKGSIAES